MNRRDLLALAAGAAALRPLMLESAEPDGH